MSPWRRFFTTYGRILKLAYQVSPSLLSLVIILNSLWGLTNLPVLYINKLLIDTVIAGVGRADYWPYLKIIGLPLLARTLIEFARYFFSHWNNTMRNRLIRLSHRYVNQLLGQKIHLLDVPTVESPSFQDKFKKIERESAQRIWGLLWPLAQLPDAFFTVFSGLVPILTFNPFISLVVVLGSIPRIILDTRMVKYEYQIVTQNAPKWRIWGWIFYYFTSLKNVYENKILGVSSQLGEKLASLEGEIIDAEYQFSKTRSTCLTWATLPELVISALVNGYFFFLAIIQKITLGSAQMLYGATTTLGSGVGSIVNNVSEIQQNYQFVDDLFWFLDLQPKFGQTGETPKARFTRGIEFDHVWFKYPNSTDWVLKDVSFSISLTENVAIVGENGAGKTTLIKLLCAFYQPQKGSITVDGTDIFVYKHSSYLKHIAALFQDFSNYAFSARESIGFGQVSAMERLDKIQQVAKLVEIHDYISSLAKGYDTPLDKEFEGGVEPSKGQWQRIALARTIFRHSQIVILDEPTSNVDAKAEEEIFAKVIKLTADRILILISHRFATVRKADRILVLDKGTITESGSHDQLMARKGTYAKLFTLQAKSYQ